MPSTLSRASARSQSSATVDSGSQTPRQESGAQPAQRTSGGRDSLAPGQGRVIARQLRTAAPRGNKSPAGAQTSASPAQQRAQTQTDGDATANGRTDSVPAQASQADTAAEPTAKQLRDENEKLLEQNQKLLAKVEELTLTNQELMRKVEELTLMKQALATAERLTT
jgi:hypothetical protein